VKHTYLVASIERSEAISGFIKSLAGFSLLGVLIVLTVLYIREELLGRYSC